jgi:hypothetical protein
VESRRRESCSTVLLLTLAQPDSHRMHALTSATWLGIIILSLSGCSRASRQAEHTLLPADYHAARQAISLEEVSLMLRNGYKDPAIVAEVSRRHVPEEPDAQTEAALIQSGAGPALIEALRGDANVLTAREKEAYEELALQRAAVIEQERLAQQNQGAGETTKKRNAVEQTLKNMRDAEAYKPHRESLETRIASQEAQITLLRKNGYSEGQLVEYNDKLNRSRQELYDLKRPMP